MNDIIALANDMLQREPEHTEYRRGYYSALNDLWVRRTGNPFEPKICQRAGCDRMFVDRPSGKPRRYCSNSHRVMAHRARKKKLQEATA